MDFKIILKGKRFYSLEEFAKNIYLYPDEAFFLIKSKKFLKFLYNFDENMYNKIVSLLSAPFAQDELLFKVQYTLNPLMELRTHGYLFKDFKALGAKILTYGPNVDIYLKDFLKYHLLSYYMVNSKYDEKEPVLFQEVQKLEEEFLTNENRAYFKLGFLLEGSKIMFYNGKKFTSCEEFLMYVMEPTNIIDFAKSFIKSQYTFAWLETLGYTRQITLFENLVQSVELKEKLNDNIGEV